MEGVSERERDGERERGGGGRGRERGWMGEEEAEKISWIS